ncbi:hcalcium-binding protein [Vibrio rotiferianus]|uniref:Hcalcium-binding protein n=1 Tax=Vibrio rotiferianus TaxID=190895 RepID=A0ABX3DA84_9VIBR|nr:calcium-binding protein [Vibrio rotiferianus]OHY93675.1 hcalcium-binding protein [Vibrio rotiferianus]
MSRSESSSTAPDYNWIFGTAEEDDVKGTVDSFTPDVFVGDSGDEKFVGFGGNDYIDGNGGNDYLLGGKGEDHVSGGSGNDYLSGGLGDDFLYGGEGDDILFDYSGNNFLNAGLGNDKLIVGDGNSTLAGGSGNDEFVFSNRLSVKTPEGIITSNEIEIKAEVLDFNIFEDKLTFDLGRDTDGDGKRDSFLESEQQLELSFNEYGWAVYSSDEFNIEVTLKGVDQAYVDYMSNKDINIFDFT